MPVPAWAVPVTFKYTDPSATRITVAGDFNGWSKESHEMFERRLGQWEMNVDLEPGRYTYKFVVDGDMEKANKLNRYMIVTAAPVLPEGVTVKGDMTGGEKGLVRKEADRDGSGRMGVEREGLGEVGWESVAPVSIPPTAGIGGEKGLARRRVQPRPVPKPREEEPEKKIEPPKTEEPEESQEVREPPAVVSRLVSVPAPAPEPAPSAAKKETAAAAKALTPFSYTDPKAKRVTLAGEFNDWNKDALPMTKSEGGVWEAAVELKPGIYEYKYVVDGDWDKGNKDNRMVTVKEDRTSGRADGQTIGRGEEAAKPKAEAKAPVPAMVQRVEREEEPAMPKADAKAPIKMEFKYKDMNAKKVGVGGEFNEWQWEKNQMTKGPGGAWSTTIAIAPGEYAYKIVVDGDWRDDPSNPLKKEINGIKNSLIRVSPALEIPDEQTGRLKAGVTAWPDGTVRFVLDEPGANSVCLAGAFNNWLPDAWPLMRRRDGLWVVTIVLNPGVYTYQYVVDGVWKPDPANAKFRESGYGKDSIVEVLDPSRIREIVPVPFKIRSEKAKRITLAGTFNNWDPNAVELRRRSEGWWETTLELKPGSYEYKFLVDGDWKTLNADNRKIEVR